MIQTAWGELLKVKTGVIYGIPKKWINGNNNVYARSLSHFFDQNLPVVFYILHTTAANCAVNRSSLHLAAAKHELPIYTIIFQFCTIHVFAGVGRIH
jgi:hypothetical protein